MRRPYASNITNFIDDDNGLRNFVSGSVNLDTEQQTPFYIEPVNTSATIKITSGSAKPSYMYSYNGSTWNTGPTITTTAAVSIPCNGYTKIYFKALNDTGYIWDKVHFDVAGGFSIGGNIMSLVYGTAWKTAGEPSGSYCFRAMFSGNTNIRHAEKLVLGNKKVKDSYNVLGKEITYGYVCAALPTYAYYQMFYNSSLISSPRVIGASSQTNSFCCEQMLSKCTSMTNGPISIRGKFATARAFAYAISSCTSLKYTPLQIYFTTSGTSAGTYAKAFEGCFSGNTNMVVGIDRSKLPTYTNKRAGKCLIYQDNPGSTSVLPTQHFFAMFNNCSKLEYMTICIKYSTTYGTNSFQTMFQNAASMKYLFYDCSIKPGVSHTNWFNGVTTSGKLVAPSGGSWGLSTGVSTYPSTWTFATSE